MPGTRTSPSASFAETGLRKDRFYIIDLDSEYIQAAPPYPTFWAAIDAERAAGRTGRFTALSGAHLRQRWQRPWKLPDQARS